MCGGSIIITNDTLVTTMVSNVPHRAQINLIRFTRRVLDYLRPLNRVDNFECPK